MKKILIYLNIILLFFGFCSTNEGNNSVNEITPILSEYDDSEKILIPVLTREEIIDLCSTMKDELGISKPLFLNEKLIGEISLFRNFECIGKINNKYKTGQITYDEYSEELENFYNTMKSTDFGFIITIFSDIHPIQKDDVSTINNDITNINNWKFRLKINNEEFSQFILNNNYGMDDLLFKVEKLSIGSNEEYYKLSANFNINKLPDECKPHTLLPLGLILSLELEMEYIILEETITVKWNNMEFYPLFENDTDMKYEVIGNNIEFSKPDDTLLKGIEPIYLNTIIKNFPFEIENINNGLFNATVYSVGKFLNHNEYYNKEMIEYILTFITNPDNSELADILINISKKAPFTIMQTLFGEFVFKFDDYFIERKLINVSPNSELGTKYNIEKISFIVKKDKIISLTFMFNKSKAINYIKELINLYGNNKTQNNLQPYSWDDNKTRLTYTISDNAINIIDKKELVKMINIMGQFHRYFNYFYDKLYGNSL